MVYFFHNCAYAQCAPIFSIPNSFQVKLKDIQVTKPRTIEADYISGGYLKEKVGCIYCMDFRMGVFWA